jgi:hypothetical protein
MWSKKCTKIPHPGEILRGLGVANHQPRKDDVPRLPDSPDPGLIDALSTPCYFFRIVQVTIDIPDDLAKQLKGEQEQIVELIQRGLAQPLSNETALAEEVIQFLGHGPDAAEIIRFKPSAASAIAPASYLKKIARESLRPLNERRSMKPAPGIACSR